MSMTIIVRLISGRFSGGAPLEMLERPMTVVGGGSAIILNMRTASTDLARDVLVAVDGEDERVEEDVRDGQAGGLGRRQQLLHGDGGAAVGGGRDAVDAHGEGDDAGAVLRRQLHDAVEAVRVGGGGVQHGRAACRP